MLLTIFSGRDQMPNNALGLFITTEFEQAKDKLKRLKDKKTISI